MISPGKERFDGRAQKYTMAHEAWQGAAGAQERDGTWVVAYEEDGVTRIGKLTIVPDRTDLDASKHALHRARNHA